MIGIDQTSNLIYEGRSFYGHGLWPGPLLLRATFVVEASGWEHVPSSGELRGASCVFREDHFDPVTRIRRGRFYDTLGIRSQPDNWWVHRHPVIPEEVGQVNHQGQFSKLLVTFTPMRRVVEQLQDARDPIVVLGAQPAVSAWSVVLVERGDDEHDVVTLKARLNFGFLPELILDAIPQDGRARVTREVSKVVDAAHRQSGIALVDLCRAAVTVVLAEWLVGEGAPDTIRLQDLGQVIAKMPAESGLRRSAADIVRLLHLRGKPNEQLRLGTLHVTEADGGFALDALAFLLRDLGWAR